MSISSPGAKPEEFIECPFCHEPDFDLPGLKMHLVLGWCEVWAALENPRNKK